MTQPPSKSELDRINAELEKLRQPKPPTQQLRPGGSMGPSADRVDQAVLAQQIKKREERAREIRESLDRAKAKIERERDKFRSQ